MKITIMWYARNQETYRPDYELMHKKTIIGKTASEIMKAIRWIEYHHDLALFTPIAIINVED